MTGRPAGRVLVAGVGNDFLGDDGFGPLVARELARRPFPDGVEIGDFGTGGVHLVYELLDGCDLFVLVDAAQRGNAPGTVTVVEVNVPDAPAGALVQPDAPAGALVQPGVPAMDGHGLTPDEVFAMLAAMGGRPGRSLLVACEPADLGPRMGLSAPVRAAVPHAVRAVEEILRQELQQGINQGIRQGEGERDEAHDGDDGDRGGDDRGDHVLPARP